MGFMKRFLSCLLCLLLLVLVSHIADSGLSAYGKKRVSSYVLSDQNPARDLYSRDGEILNPNLGSTEIGYIHTAVQEISRINNFINIFRIIQQTFICSIFAFLWLGIGAVKCRASK